jgi:pectinesterase
VRGAQALAARVNGDRAAFYRCRFLSYQDTILDDKKGRHYYSDCYVEGATDFLFGPGKALFEVQIDSRRSRISTLHTLCVSASESIENVFQLLQFYFNLKPYNA